MKKYEILYDWPVARIAALSDSAETEAYVDSLGEGSAGQTELLKLIDSLRAYGNELTNARADKRLYVQWTEIRKVIDEIEQHFPAFPNLDANRLKLTLLIAEELALALPPPAARADPVGLPA